MLRAYEGEASTDERLDDDAYDFARVQDYPLYDKGQAPNRSNGQGLAQRQSR
jgi:hypothetical protein